MPYLKFLKKRQNLKLLFAAYYRLRFKGKQTNLVDVHLIMLPTKYQGACGFRQDFFSCFPYISLHKTCDSLGGAFFRPRGKI